VSRWSRRDLFFLTCGLRVALNVLATRQKTIRWSQSNHAPRIFANHCAYKWQQLSRKTIISPLSSSSSAPVGFFEKRLSFVLNSSVQHQLFLILQMAPKAKPTASSSKAVAAETQRGGSSMQEAPLSGITPSGLTFAIRRVYRVLITLKIPFFFEEEEPSARVRNRV